MEVNTNIKLKAKLFAKMREYGWHLEDNSDETFNNYLKLAIDNLNKVTEVSEENAVLKDNKWIIPVEFNVDEYNHLHFITDLIRAVQDE